MKHLSGKKTVLGILILLTVLCICAAASATETGTCGDHLTWVLDDYGLLTISGTGPMTDFDGSTPWIPFEVNNAVVEDGVTSIGKNAFNGCNGLESITIGNSVTSIGVSAFGCCYGLTSVTIPDSVTRIENYTFFGCTALVEVVLPRTVTHIGIMAFGNCSSLYDVCYGGTADERRSISFGDGNDPLLNAQWLYCFNPDLVDIAGGKIKAIKNQVYTGKKITPAVTVIFEGVRLTAGTDYRVSYQSNKNIGTAKVTVEGIGDYTGTLNASFKIVPKAVSLSKPDNKVSGQLNIKWKKASGITGYEIQYGLKKSLKDAKTVTIKKAKTTSTVIKKLKKGKTYYIRIRAYKTLKGKKYYSAWSAAKAVKVK